MRQLAIASVGLALMAAAIPATAETTAPALAKAPLYVLGPGTRLVYNTSATLSVAGPQAMSQTVECKSAFTVLAASEKSRTIFASVDATIPDDKKTTEPRRTRFTFELGVDGEIGKIAGMPPRVFPGLEPTTFFLPVPTASGESVAVPLPPTDTGFPLKATLKADGDARQVTAKLDEPASALGGGLDVKKYEISYAYDTKSQSIAKVKLAAQVSQAPGAGDPETTPPVINADYVIERVAVEKLPAEALDALRKDVAAGVNALNTLQTAGGAGGEKPDLKPIIESVRGYLKENPKGEFSFLFAGISDQLVMAEKLSANAEKIKVGEKAPAFDVKTFDGGTIKLADLRGKVVLLDFWASWCFPCRVERPKIEELQKEWADKGLVIVGISADKTEEALRRYLEKEPTPWKQIYEGDLKDGTVLFQYGVSSFPTVILIDREGVIRGVGLRGDEMVTAVGEEMKKAAK